MHINVLLPGTVKWKAFILGIAFLYILSILVSVSLFTKRRQLFMGGDAVVNETSRQEEIAVLC